MSDEYKIDDAKINEIAKAFSIDKHIVEILYKAYLGFSPYLEKQFLAHAMRGIECYFRKRMKNDRFIVICEPYKKGECSENQSQASSYYYPPKTVIRCNDKQNSSFIINYNEDLPEKELRDHIAHEIGHLFLLAAFDKEKDQGTNINTEINTEPLSSIFGIFTMSERNDFYTNFDIAARNHKNWQEILASFLKIHNS